MSLDSTAMLVFQTVEQCKYLSEYWPQKVPMLIPRTCDITTAQLRLDSQVFLFSADKGVYVIEEAYAVKNGPLIIERVGRWKQNRNQFEQDCNPNIWERRTDLRGIELINLHLDFPPLMFWSEEEEKYDGFMNDILRDLERKLNFTAKYAEPKDGAWAGRDEDGNQMIIMIIVSLNVL